MSKIEIIIDVLLLMLSIVFLYFYLKEHRLRQELADMLMTKRHRIEYLQSRMLHYKRLWTTHQPAETLTFLDLIPGRCYVFNENGQLLQFVKMGIHASCDHWNFYAKFDAVGRYSVIYLIEKDLIKLREVI